MALSEFVALEAAYRALQPLDAAARSRALRWLTDALAVQEQLPESSGRSEIENPVVPAGEGVARPEPGAVESPDAAPSSGERPVERASAEVEPREEGAEPDARDSGSPRTRSRKRAGTPAAAARSGHRTRGGRGGKTAAKQPEKERVYRRMPPVDEVLAAYRQVGTVSGLAGFFDVPRHTVQGWARRLRGAGHEIGRKAEAGE